MVGPADFWVEKIENFEKLPNGWKSIGDVFAECLRAFWSDLQRQAVVLESIVVRYGLVVPCRGPWVAREYLLFLDYNIPPVVEPRATR